MKKQKELIELTISEEIRDDMQIIFRKSLSESLHKIHQKHKEDVLFPMAIHILACIVFEIIYQAAPDMAEADRFIIQAWDEVKELTK